MCVYTPFIEPNHRMRENANASKNEWITETGGITELKKWN